MITIGIDIGLTGAVAAVDSRGSCSVTDLPIKVEGDKRRIDGFALLHVLRGHIPIGEPALVLIEDVQPRPQGNSNAHGNSMHSQGSMMRTRGAIETVVDIARLELALTHPQTWKKFYGLIGSDKAASMAMAQRLYPDAPLTLVKHHNRAEAVLLAHFAQKKLT